MTNRAGNGGGTTVYLLGSLFEGLFQMAFTVILVRLISQTDFGAWRQFMSLANIVWNVTVFGLPRSLIYFYSTSPQQEQGAIARRTLWIVSGLAAISSIVFYFGLPYAAERFDSPGLAEHALLFSVHLALNFPVFIAFSLLVAANRRTLVAGTRIALSLLKLSSLVFLLWGDASLHTFLLVLNGWAAVQFVVLIVLYMKISGPVVAPLWQNIRAQLKFSADVAVQSMAGQVASESDKLLVSAAYSPARFGSYAVGARELPLVPMVPYSITDSISPDLSRLAVARKFDEFRNLWHKWIKRAALLMYPVFALVLFQHKEIITLLYTAEYLEGALPLMIIGFMIPLRVTSYFQILLNLNGSRDVMYASISILVSITSLSWVFMHLFGLWGPALAVVISEYVVNLAVMARIGWRTEIPLARVMPWGYLFKLLLIAITCGALALPVVGLLGDFALIWRFFGYGMAMLILYAAVTLSFSMVESDDLALLRSYVRR